NVSAQSGDGVGRLFPRTFFPFCRRNIFVHATLGTTPPRKAGHRCSYVSCTCQGGTLDQGLAFLRAAQPAALCRDAGAGDLVGASVVLENGEELLAISDIWAAGALAQGLVKLSGSHTGGTASSKANFKSNS